MEKSRWGDAFVTCGGENFVLVPIVPCVATEFVRTPYSGKIVALV